MKYYIYNNQILDPNSAFQTNAKSYPSNWLSLASAQDLTDNNITSVDFTDPTPPGGKTQTAIAHSWDGTKIVATPTYVDTPLNIIPYSTWISRFTDAEYTTLLQKRAQAITAGVSAITLIHQMDQVCATGVIDLNSSLSQTVKTSLVSSSILTQPRADLIFS